MNIINYTKLCLWSAIYYFQKDKSETIFKIIVKNIKESGCVTIKFVQWLLPKIETIYEESILDCSGKIIGTNLDQGLFVDQEIEKIVLVVDR